MSAEHVSFVPNPSGRGRFVRHSYAQQRSSNRVVEIGRFFYNFICGILQLFNLLHYSLTTFNNMLASLPFCIRYIVHAVLAFCFPFYSIYRGFMVLINRIQNITYPLYRAVTLLARLVSFFITLPMRIIGFVINQTQDLLKNLLKFLIVVALIIGSIALLLDENQINYIKSYVRNTTDIVLKQSSMI